MKTPNTKNQTTSKALLALHILVIFLVSYKIAIEEVHFESTIVGVLLACALFSAGKISEELWLS